MPVADLAPDPGAERPEGPVECIFEDERWRTLDLDALADRAARATLTVLGHDPAHFALALLAADDARIAALNAEFRGKPVPTDVLSWPAVDLSAASEGGVPRAPAPGSADDPSELGDIALAWETCSADAARAGIPLPDHLCHLIVHGVLHLLGFDHSRDGDAALMARTEVTILAEQGIPDPYGGTDPSGPV